MKQYNVVVKLPTKSKFIFIKRIAVPSDMQDTEYLTNDMAQPKLRPKISNCMDLMKATALKAGLEELGVTNVFIEELSDRDYRDLETKQQANQLNTFIQHFSPFVSIKTKS